MVDEYVGMTVQKLSNGKHRSCDLTQSQQWLWNSASTRHVLSSADCALRDHRISHIPTFFCGGIYKNIRTKITHILLMNWNETSKAVSWTLWHKLNIRLFVTWGRKWMLASLSMVGISSPYRKTVGFQLQNKNFKHVQILVIVNLKKKVCGFSKTP